MIDLLSLSFPPFFFFLRQKNKIGPLLWLWPAFSAKAYGPRSDPFWRSRKWPIWQEHFLKREPEIFPFLCLPNFCLENFAVHDFNKKNSGFWLKTISISVLWIPPCPYTQMNFSKVTFRDRHSKEFLDCLQLSCLEILVSKLVKKDWCYHFPYYHCREELL